MLCGPLVLRTFTTAVSRSAVHGTLSASLAPHLGVLLVDANVFVFPEFLPEDDPVWPCRLKFKTNLLVSTFVRVVMGWLGVEVTCSTPYSPSQEVQVTPEASPDVGNQLAPTAVGESDLEQGIPQMGVSHTDDEAS